MPRINPVPQMRIREKVDACMATLDYAGVERTLNYWLMEAQSGNDLRGELMIRNEFIGHFRKTGEQKKAEIHAAAALSLIERLGMENSLSHAQTCINIGTACNAFGENEKALQHFETARAICEQADFCDPALLGGLYNNMGLNLTALGQYEQALELYEKAMAQMAKVPAGELEMAVTCLNMADTVRYRKGMEDGEQQIFALLDRASDLLHTPSLPRNGYYAYVCGRCAPVFAYYGYFFEADELKRIEEDIHARA